MYISVACECLVQTNNNTAPNNAESSIRQVLQLKKNRVMSSGNAQLGNCPYLVVYLVVCSLYHCDNFTLHLSSIETEDKNTAAVTT